MKYANHDKVDLEHIYIYIYIYIYIFTYIKMSKDSSAKYYQNNKERL